jgi:hypothetical protein
VDHSEYARLLSRIAALPRIKKVFVRSGVRFDYLMLDPDRTFFRQLVREHTSGQLKVAPEHSSNHALSMMGKPPIEVFEGFKREFFAYCQEIGLEQYLVPYLMSSHPGATMQDAVEMALWLKKWGYSPEQVQDFYPTPGTISTVMYYTGIHPMTGKSVYVCTDYHEKQLQRALLQFKKPENANLVREALRLAGREDLIGTDPTCLVRPAFGQGGGDNHHQTRKGKGQKSTAQKGSGQRGVASTPRGKKPTRTKSPAPFYQTFSEQKKKKSKLERIFGEEATAILREADTVSGGKGHGGKGAGASRGAKTTQKGRAKTPHLPKSTTKRTTTKMSRGK